MLAALGQFIFSLNTAPFNELSRNKSPEWAKGSRVGKRSTTQFINTGEDKITLKGVLAPQITGGESNITELMKMSDAGKPYILTTRPGEILGLWIITGINQTKTNLLANGRARKIEFTLNLERYGEDHATSI